MKADYSLAARFESGQIEEKWYDYWLEKDIFHSERDIKKKPYTVLMPPPNVTGSLHLGHALNDTLQDVMIRFKKMRGYNTLWIAGTDHAGIATQAVVERKIYAEEEKTRQDLGREQFVARIWEWKEKYGNKILGQLRKLGVSCDWSRTRFTLDEGLSRAVREAFVKMYNEGLIYQGARIVNWDCALETAVSDDEIEMVPEKGMLAYIKYPIQGQPGKFIEVATTRPETLFGDLAIAVHPEDERYTDFIGKSVILPLIEREIPVIADSSVEAKFGTGAVKVTPGHDAADFERGRRAGLGSLIVFNPDGTLNEACGKNYQGLDRYQARKQVLADLEAQGLLSRITDHDHNVPRSDRSKTIIEPLVSEQWFVKMKPLVEPAIKAVEEGEIHFVPERWSKVYLQWLYSVEDWCISRQLWWGHRIPVYYDEDGSACASVDEPEVHPETGKKIVRQDDDVLDTWFSSALWPLSTLGWPDQSVDQDYYFPTNTLFTARDIIYLWVARMVIQSYFFTGKKPFGQVFIHPTILDEYGKRMSKSLGNGVDPLDMIELYGVDSFRFSLAALTTDNQDCQLAIKREKTKENKYGKVHSVQQFENARNFVNKIWNACRFALNGIEGFEEKLESLSKEQQEKLKALEVEALEDRWILSRLTQVLVNFTDSLERFRFHEATQVLYHYIWDEFCDWYLEVIKPRLQAQKGDELSKLFAQATLLRILDSILKMLHPFCPFVTEEIWQHIRELLAKFQEPFPALVLVLEPWPKAEKGRIDKETEREFGDLQELIRGIRNIRAEHQIPFKKELSLLLKLQNKVGEEVLSPWKQEIMKHQCGLSELRFITKEEEIPEHAASVVTKDIEAFVPLEGLIDLEMEKKRLIVHIEKLKAQVHGLKRKLENTQYLERAPQEIVQESRDLLVEKVHELESFEERLESLVK